MKFISVLVLFFCFAALSCSKAGTSSDGSTAPSASPAASPSPSPTSLQTRLYVTDPSAGVGTCTINATTGVLSSCYWTSGPNGWGSPHGIAFGSSGSNYYAYIADTAGDEVDPATVNTATGALSGIAGGSMGQPRGIAYATVAGTSRIYTADYNLGTIVICTVSGTTISSCATSNGGIATSAWVPNSIAVATVGGNMYAYVSTGGNVYVCSISATTGLITSCSVSNGNVTAGSWNTYGIAAAVIGGNAYVYVADSYGYIYLCNVDSTTGLLTTCTTSNGGISNTVWSPEGLTVSNLGGTNYFAYVAGGDGNVYTCSVSSSTGALSGCAVSAAPAGGWTQPTSMTVFGP